MSPLILVSLVSQQGECEARWAVIPQSASRGPFSSVQTAGRPSEAAGGPQAQQRQEASLDLWGANAADDGVGGQQVVETDSWLISLAVIRLIQ